MKKYKIIIGACFFGFCQARSQNIIAKPFTKNNMKILQTKSHIDNLNIAIHYIGAKKSGDDYPVLFLHGSSFPTLLSFGFSMENTSWMTNLSENGYDVYSLDFLGYGNSDRYPEMENNSVDQRVVGRAEEVVLDVERAVNLVLRKSGKEKVYLIGHSWGGSVAALYASKFSEKVEKLVLFATITARNEKYETEKIQGSFVEMTPEERIDAMKLLTPNGKSCQLEKEVFMNWGQIWKESDPLCKKLQTNYVRFPSGPNQDVEDLLHNKSYYNPENIKAPTLIIRGSRDQYPNDKDAQKLFALLKNADSKKYVTLDTGTHVAHLETSRKQLYNETLIFLRSRQKM
jgi:pimeloyl-ACP methyl ester carboxylesterase